jgi:hypothetical protein
MPERRRPVLIAALGVAYTVLAVAALARSGYQLLTGVASGRAAVAVALSGLSGVVYLCAAVGLRRGTPRSLRVSRWCLVLELAGVLLVGAAELVVGGFGRSTVWSGLGIGYGFAPLILPSVGLWLLRSVSSSGAGEPAAAGLRPVGGGRREEHTGA